MPCQEVSRAQLNAVRSWLREAKDVPVCLAPKLREANRRLHLILVERRKGVRK